MLILLLALTLGVADAGKIFYEVQQQEQQPPDDGYLCPDQASRCPHTATCCQLSSGEWGCCPVVQAAVMVVYAEEKMSPNPLKDVWCNRSHKCGNGETCCWQPNHNWGCCPSYRPVCNSDGSCRARM